LWSSFGIVVSLVLKAVLISLHFFKERRSLPYELETTSILSSFRVRFVSGEDCVAVGDIFFL
jgi:hypothetical protein